MKNEVNERRKEEKEEKRDYWEKCEVSTFINGYKSKAKQSKTHPGFYLLLFGSQWDSIYTNATPTPSLNFPSLPHPGD